MKELTASPGHRYGWRGALVMPSAYFGTPSTPAGGLLKYWNGSEFSAKPLRAWDGSTWAIGVLKHWTGSSWQATAP